MSPPANDRSIGAGKISVVSGMAGLPCLLIHGGGGRGELSPERTRRKDEVLADSANRAFQILRDGGSAAEAVTAAVRSLESSPLFNAGIGGVLQRDGRSRLTASFMDGAKQCFSAVSLIENVENPIDLARALQSRRNRVIGPPGNEQLAAELGVPRTNLLTEEAIAVWKKQLAESEKSGTGTVGAVAVDIRGRMAAATSTGGYGADTPGRMSDVSSVAGNYASASAAVSCTGVGEQIIDAGVAVRLESRVRDGMSIEEAARRCHAEAVSANHFYAWICLDRNGAWAAGSTTQTLFWAMRKLEE